MIYRFETCRIDTRCYGIESDGHPVSIEPKVFDLLVFLIEQRDRVVTRDEILDAVWEGRLVSDAALSGCIKAARKAIGDDGKQQRLIRTIHGRGFRFAGEVTGEPDTAGAMAETAATTSGGVTNYDELLTGIDLSLPGQPSIVVLPFQFLGDDAQRIIADGLTLDITTRLARLRWMFVIARGTAFSFRDSSADPAAIAGKLGVRYVLLGSTQVSGPRIRVRVALSDALAGREIWAEDFDRNLRDVLTLQDEISTLVTAAIESEIERAERTRSFLYASQDLDAWSAYHRGCVHMYRSNREDFDLAESYLRRALMLEPKAPRPFAALSFIHWQRVFLEIAEDPERSEKEAFDCAEHCVELDPRDPLGHWALGRAHLLRKDYDNATIELLQSIELNPSFAMGHYSLGLTYGLHANFRESLAAVSQARRLSPYDPMSYAMLAQQAVNLLMEGDLEEAATVGDRAARQPNAHFHVVFIGAYCNALAGRHEIAERHASALIAQKPGYRVADYFRALPIQSDELKTLVTKASLRLGLGK